MSITPINNQNYIISTLDNMTYNQYESSNPLRLDYETNLSNEYLKKSANIAQDVGAELYSFYTNPFYIPHKIIQFSTFAVDQYKKYIEQTLINYNKRESHRENIKE